MNLAPPLRLEVGTAGLDLLSTTRVKVACSLLLADRIDITLVPWSDGGALLLAHEDTVDGRDAIASARDRQVPVLAVSRTASGADRIAHGASVREIADALRQRLLNLEDVATAAVDTALRLPPLLESMRLDAPGSSRVLMENGLLRVVVDPQARQLHMLRRMPMAQLLEAALAPNWHATRLSQATWESAYRDDVTGSHAIETLWWRVALHDGVQLPPVDDAAALSAWPDLEAASAEPHWLLLLACLQQREWRAVDLASATGLPLPDVQRTLSRVRLSGLARRGGASAWPARRRNGPQSASQARTFLRVAKRFGLRLLGMEHG